MRGVLPQSDCRALTGNRNQPGGGLSLYMIIMCVLEISRIEMVNGEAGIIR